MRRRKSQVMGTCSAPVPARWQAHPQSEPGRRRCTFMLGMMRREAEDDEHVHQPRHVPQRQQAQHRRLPCRDTRRVSGRDARDAQSRDRDAERATRGARQPSQAPPTGRAPPRREGRAWARSPGRSWQHLPGSAPTCRAMWTENPGAPDAPARPQQSWQRRGPRPVSYPLDSVPLGVSHGPYCALVSI